jgi:hypothetical protein
MKEKISDRWKRFTRRITSKIPRLSRPWRVVRNVVCIVLAAYLAWMFSGGYAFTAQGAFRQAEKRNLVGRSEILLQERDYTSSERLTWILGRTDNGYVAGWYRHCKRGWYGWSRSMSYYERQDVTLVPMTENEYGQDTIDLVLLADVPGVSRGVAELTFDESGSLNGLPYDYHKTYSVEFLPGESDVLRGTLKAETEDDSSWESELERSQISDFYSEVIPVTVRLYDEAGELVYETSFDRVEPTI